MVDLKAALQKLGEYPQSVRGMVEMATDFQQALFEIDRLRAWLTYVKTSGGPFEARLCELALNGKRVEEIAGT